MTQAPYSLMTYLRNVADDQREAGRECTADDYEQAAAAIETMAAQIAALRKQKDQLNAALNDLKNAAAVALVESADHYNRKWLTDAICQANAVQEGRA